MIRGLLRAQKGEAQIRQRVTLSDRSLHLSHVQTLNLGEDMDSLMDSTALVHWASAVILTMKGTDRTRDPKITILCDISVFYLIVSEH